MNKVLVDRYAHSNSSEKFQKNVKKASVERKQSRVGRVSGLKELWATFKNNNRKILFLFIYA